MSALTPLTLLSRRGFACAVTAGSVAGVFAAAADTAPPAAERGPLPAGDKSPNPGGKGETDATELLAPEELLLAAHLQLYPSARLTPERVQGLREGLRRNRINHVILMRVPLDNSEEPAPVFGAWRGEG